jgi:enediyne biosynthesis protein E4
MGLIFTAWSGAATVVDLNEDGYPDVYLTNMQGRNHYFENQKGKGFIDKTAVYFPKTPWGAMHAKFLDFNDDGLMDLYVVDMHSDMNDAQIKLAGKMDPRVEKSKSEAWCTAQYDETFLQGSSNSIFGNAFYVNRGGGKFEERSDPLGVETYWPWGISVGDVNADGYADVFVAAGMGFPFRYGINSVLLNQRGERFYDSEFLLGVEPRPSGEIEIPYFTLDCSGADKDHRLAQGKTGSVTFKGTVSTRSSVIFDLDDDGDLDIVTLEWNYHPQVLLNLLSGKKTIKFLKIKLVGTKSNRDGLGALVKVHAGGKTYSQYADGNSGYFSQSALPFYFGLGEAPRVDKIEVRWPSGLKQNVVEGLELNKLLTIREPSN